MGQQGHAWICLGTAFFCNTQFKYLSKKRNSDGRHSALSDILATALVGIIKDVVLRRLRNRQNVATTLFQASVLRAFVLSVAIGWGT